jgi:hypothetical protein
MEEQAYNTLKEEAYLEGMANGERAAIWFNCLPGIIRPPDRYKQVEVFYVSGFNVGFIEKKEELCGQTKKNEQKTGV